MRRLPGALGLLAVLTALLAPATAPAGVFKDPLASNGNAAASLTSGAPVNAAPPTVSGTLVQGETLVASSGSWAPSATSATYQWQRDAGSGFANVPGATGTSFTLSAADIGAKLRVHVIAANAAGNGAADSAATATIIAGDPVNTVAPSVSGSTVGGRTLTAATGTWYPRGQAYSYRWQRDTGSGFADIAGATGPAYTTVPADVSASIRVRVTAINAYNSATADAAGVGPITSGRPVSTSPPAITGTVKRGAPLAVNSGAWNPAPTSYAYQWQTDAGSGWEDVDGADTTSYTPTGDDVGNPLRVQVTTANAFGTTVVTTAATVDVALDPPVNVGSPSVSGTAKRTFTLTAASGTWSPAGASFTYQWQRDAGSGFADIATATSSTYTLVSADVGAAVRVVVTATNVDGATPVASPQTAVVSAATPSVATAPLISAGQRVGDALTTTDGSWSPAATSYAYQWQRRVNGVFVDISGATSKTYTLVTADAGTSVRAKVTATNADGTGVGYSGASPGIVAPPVAPTTIAAPAGTLQDASVLTADPGVWVPSSTTFTYQWLRCPSGATAIGGCVTVGFGQYYTLVGPDVGHAMAVRVTGLTSNIATVATSAFTADVTGRALTLTTAPRITGTVQVASQVVGVAALFSVPTTSERYQWRRCATDGTGCVDIPGATRKEYAVGVADRGQALVLHEDAASPGQTASTDSAPAVVADQPIPVNAVLPVVTGLTKRTGALQVTQGTWANSPKTYNYGWQRCAADGTGCSAIAGETRATHIATSDDVGHTLRGVVTATNTEGTVAAASAPTAVIAAVLPRLRTIGPIAGTLQVPQSLQAYRSNWDTTSDTRYAYQWQRCDAAGSNCADIPGARSQSYRLTATDARARLRVVHTATNPDGSTVVPTPVTAPILPAAPGVAAAPRLSGVGRPDVGKTLTLIPGRWSAATEITSKTLQFWRCSARCVTLPTGGAGSYVLTDDDAGSMIRGSETAVGPGGTVVSWATAWLGPVHSQGAATAGFAAFGARAVTRSLTAGDGVVLARATVGGAGASAAVAAAVAMPHRARVVLRRAAGLPHGAKLRAWACLAKPAADVRAPCTKSVWLKRRAVTLRLAVPKGQRLNVVVVRKSAR